MKKRRYLCLILAVMLLISLFAGCGGNAGNAGNAGGVGNAGNAGNTGSTEPAPGESTSGGGEEAPEPEASLDYLAAGKYATDEKGFPTEKYEYELPLTSRDVELSFFTLCWTPQYLPDGLMANVPYWIEMQEMTGVHLEFVQVTNANCTEQFAVLLAADDVPDIVSEGQYRYSGTQEESIEEGVFANIYDYKEYMPNYLYEVLERSKTNQNTYDSVFIKEDMMVSFYSLSTSESTTGWVLRQDMMTELGLGLSKDVTTLDKLHTVLTAFQSAYGGDQQFWPMAMYNTLELDTGKMLSGFNTSITCNMFAFSTRLKDGKVEIIGVQEDDRDAIATLSQWYGEGLITPNYNAYTNNQDMADELSQGNIGYVYMVPSDATDFAATCVDPDCLYQPSARIRKTEDQVIHYGLQGLAVGYGTFCLSAACEELPVAVTWCDWQYSNSGSEYLTYGVQGYLWDRNENGERYITDWALEHPAGYGWIRMIYANDALMEGGLSGHGDKPVNMDSEWGDYFQNVWQDVEADHAWSWLTGIKLTTEETNEVNSLTSDCMTFQTENYALFIDGSKPMSDWDSYAAELNAMGLSRMLEIYEDAYARYLAERA